MKFMRISIKRKKVGVLRPLNDEEPKIKGLSSRVKKTKHAFRVPKPKPGLLKNVILTVVAGAAGFGGGWLGAIQHGLFTPGNKRRIISRGSQRVNEIAKTVGFSVV